MTGKDKFSSSKTNLFGTHAAARGGETGPNKSNEEKGRRERRPDSPESEPASACFTYNFICFPVLADYTKDCSRFTLTLSKTNARRYNSHKSGGEKGDPRVQRCRGRRCGSPSRQEPARLEGRPGTPRSHPARPRSVSTGPLSGLLRPDSPRRHSTTREDAPINNGQGRSEGCRGTASQSSVPGVGVAPEAGRPGASELPPPFSSPRVANK